MSFKIGQEIKARQGQQPRVLESSDQTDQDFLLVLTSPTTNDEVKATVESMTTSQMVSIEKADSEKVPIEKPETTPISGSRKRRSNSRQVMRISGPPHQVWSVEHPNLVLSSIPTR